MFELEIIKRLKQIDILNKSLTQYNGDIAIFAYYLPKHFNQNLPHVNFYTESYDIPLRGDTKLLTIELYNNDIDSMEFRRYGIEIANCLDNMSIECNKYGQLRLYLANNPEYKKHPINKREYGEIKFVLRGDLKGWGIV